MHGRVKVRTTEEEKRRKEIERAKKVTAYQSLMQKIFLKRAENQFDKELLELISQVLVGNPDIYTLWNIRRETCIALSKSSDEDINLPKLFDDELNLTEHCLKINHKSYCAWHHRVWVLDTREDANWKKEIDLCNYYLKLDERNFHCWDYRRQIVERANISLQDEFIFTTAKIKDNFSNYSAWHYRSKLLIKLFPDIQGERPIQEKNHRDELEMVLNAAFTDPNDTSAWFYQRWLLGRIRNDIRLSTARVSTSESLICFSHNVMLNFVKENIKVFVNDDESSGIWSSVRGKNSDVAWVLKHDLELTLSDDSSVSVVLKINSTETQKLECRSRGLYYFGIEAPSFGSKYGPSIIEELEKQLQYCHQLLELEPDSKWTLLTTAVIMNATDPIKYHKNMLAILKSLISVDALRAGYYYDLASKWIMEYFLERNIIDLMDSDKFTGLTDDISLHSLYHLQYFSGCRIVNLSVNKISNRSLPLLSMLQYCEELDLSQNDITSLQGFPKLPNLEIIHLTGNKFPFDELQLLAKCQNLRIINFGGNNVIDRDLNSEIQLMKNYIPQLSAINIIDE